MTTTIRELRCDLDDAAVEKKVGRLRHLIDHAKEVEGERDASKERYKSRLGEIETERDKLLRAVADRAEYRDVECEEREDEKRMKIDFVRTDTGVVIDEWPMSAQERQKPLDLHEDSKKPKGDSADVISKPPETPDEKKPDEQPKGKPKKPQSDKNRKRAEKRAAAKLAKENAGSNVRPIK